MSLKIAVLSSLTALGAFRAPAPPGDQAQNLGPVGLNNPFRPPSAARAAQEHRRNRRPAAWRRGGRKTAERCPLSLKE